MRKSSDSSFQPPIQLSNMLLPTAILYSLFSLFFSLTTAAPSSATILYWPVASPTPSILSRVSYDPTSLSSDVLSYDPPSTLHGDGNGASRNGQDLVRIGLFVSTPANPKQWVGSLTSLSALTIGMGSGEEGRNPKPTLQLHLGPANEIYHVSLSSSSSSLSSSISTTSPKLELVSSAPGPRPFLNKPVVVNPDGGGNEEVPEKTFLQKYWWVLLIVSFMAMSGGGEGQ